MMETEYREKSPSSLTILLKMSQNATYSSSTGGTTSNVTNSLLFTTRPPNVYFLVLKHGTLFLYESEEQILCAGVAILSPDVLIDLYPHTLLLDEIYKKEFPLRLISPTERIFDDRNEIFIYAANASEKEDWLYSLRQAVSDINSSEFGNNTFPINTKVNSSTIQNFSQQKDPKLAEAIFMERLNRYVRNNEYIDSSSQWLNAIAGRLFYNLFRSNDIERFFRAKFERKIKSSPRPFFLGKVEMTGFNPGQSLPMFSQGQLHSVTQQGEILASVNIFYPGGFRLQVATDLRWSIPGMNKTMVIPVVMSIYVKRISGRILLRIKPPPSDRLWIGFYSPPYLDIDIEPVISSRVITWSLVKSALLHFAREQMVEYVVLPNMDDISLPPLVIGDCFGGERPFELDYIPPTLIQHIQDNSRRFLKSTLPRNTTSSEDSPLIEGVATSSSSNTSNTSNLSPCPSFTSGKLVSLMMSTSQSPSSSILDGLGEETKSSPNLTGLASLSRVNGSPIDGGNNGFILTRGDLSPLNKSRKDDIYEKENNNSIASIKSSPGLLASSLKHRKVKDEKEENIEEIIDLRMEPISMYEAQNTEAFNIRNKSITSKNSAVTNSGIVPKMRSSLLEEARKSDERVIKERRRQEQRNHGHNDHLNTEQKRKLERELHHFSYIYALSALERERNENPPITATTATTGTFPVSQRQPSPSPSPSASISPLSPEATLIMSDSTETKDESKSLGLGKTTDKLASMIKDTTKETFREVRKSVAGFIKDRLYAGGDEDEVIDRQDTTKHRDNDKEEGDETKDPIDDPPDTSSNI